MRLVAIACALVLLSGCGGASGQRDTVATGTNPGSGANDAVFSVTGSAPNGADVIWGTFRSGTRSGKFPFHLKTQAFEEQYSYFVTGTLKNGGSITCKLTIGTATKIARATGGHKYCTARLTSDNNGGWK